MSHKLHATVQIAQVKLVRTHGTWKMRFTFEVRLRRRSPLSRKTTTTEIYLGRARVLSCWSSLFQRASTARRSSTVSTHSFRSNSSRQLLCYTALPQVSASKFIFRYALLDFLKSSILVSFASDRVSSPDTLLSKHGYLCARSCLIKASLYELI